MSQQGKKTCGQYSRVNNACIYDRTVNIELTVERKVKRHFS